MNEHTEWIGRERVTEDTITLERARKLSATLDLDPDGLQEGGALPRGWHWIYFHEPIMASGIGEEGHERRGGFFPPIPLPRRMWAGGRLRFMRPLLIGSQVRRISTIRSIKQKQGRSGPLAFVTVEHQVQDESGVAVLEEQDIVYLDRRTPGSAGPNAASGSSENPTDSTAASNPADLIEHFVADEIALFRFSALTFNGHRIHYDRRYSREVEHYPDIVVHAPLLALLLLDAGLRQIEKRSGPVDPMLPTDYSYRALRPLFCNESVELRARTPDAARGSGACDLWATHTERGVTTRAELVVSPQEGSR